MKKKQLKIKYGSAAFRGKVRFGLFADMGDWVKYKKKYLEDTGYELHFLMSYEDYSGKELNPFIKEMKVDEFGLELVEDDEEKNIKVMEIEDI